MDQVTALYSKHVTIFAAVPISQSVNAGPSKFDSDGSEPVHACK